MSSRGRILKQVRIDSYRLKYDTRVIEWRIK